ncbi:MAG TPA: hypothetical protein VNH64_09875 [Parvularculaceae bacterium]|nr:hypothetical protein [Parvularculaceae bacterium]
MATAPTSWLNEATTVAFILHIGGGALALISGTIAVFARKGAPLHRAAGTVFFVSMLIMATFAIYLGFVRPGQIVNVFIGVFVIYLVATAWLTVQRKDGAAGLAEKIALFFAMCLCAPFMILSFQMATGMKPLFHTAFALEGPIMIALYVMTSVLAIAAIGDAKVVLTGGISGAPRIARHLWRMCLALTMATGSAFTNGFARLLPGPYHVPPAFFFPQFLPLALLFFWIIRVRFTGWFKTNAQAALRRS